MYSLFGSNLKSINNIKSILSRQVQGNISNVELIECFNEFKKKFGGTGKQQFGK